MHTLARQLRATDYFTLGWGTMVGVGWLVIMDDWLLRGGSLGALLGFVIGGALLFPIGWVYGRLVVAMPDAAGEIAVARDVGPEGVIVLGLSGRGDKDLQAIAPRLEGRT